MGNRKNGSKYVSFVHERNKKEKAYQLCLHIYINFLSIIRSGKMFFYADLILTGMLSNLKTLIREIRA